MIDKKGNRVTFKRYVDKDATSRKWNEPLVDHAFEAGAAREGSFISFDEGDKWYEVLDKQRRDDSVMYFLYPVDQFGNKLTKGQIKKVFGERLGESYLANIEKRGYAFWDEVYDDEDPHEWLVANTYSIDQYDRNGHIDWDNDRVRALDKSDFIETFDDIDEWGRQTPVDEFLAENPDFDIDVDSIPRGKIKQTKIPSSGNAEVRANYKKFKTDYDLRKAAADTKNAERNEAHKRLYSPWGGYDEKKFFALQPDVKDSDKEKLLHNTKIFGDMPYNSEEPDFKTMKDFKKWVDSIGGDWSVVRDAFNQSSGAMSDAITNSMYYNN